MYLSKPNFKRRKLILGGLNGLYSEKVKPVRWFYTRFVLWILSLLSVSQIRMGRSQVKWTRGSFFKLKDCSLHLHCLFCSSVTADPWITKLNPCLPLEGSHHPYVKDWFYLLSEVFTVICKIFKSQILKMQRWWYIHIAIQIFWWIL